VTKNCNCPQLPEHISGVDDLAEAIAEKSREVRFLLEMMRTVERCLKPHIDELRTSCPRGLLKVGSPYFVPRLGVQGELQCSFEADVSTRNDGRDVARIRIDFGPQEGKGQEIRAGVYVSNRSRSHCLEHGYGPMVYDAIAVSVLSSGFETEMALSRVFEKLKSGYTAGLLHGLAVR